jgi:hypothetical protein
MNVIITPVNTCLLLTVYFNSLIMELNELSFFPFIHIPKVTWNIHLIRHEIGISSFFYKVGFSICWFLIIKISDFWFIVIGIWERREIE